MIDWCPYIEPSDGASAEHLLWTLIPQDVRGELRDYDRYPPGAYALYYLLCQAADSGLGKVDLVEMVNRWQHPDHPDGPPIGLSTITHVLDCADALERGGFLSRVTAGTGSRWTVLERGEKRTMPHRQAWPERVSIKQVPRRQVGARKGGRVSASKKPTTSEGAIRLVRSRAAALQLKRYTRTSGAGPAGLTEALVWAYEFPDVTLRDLAEASGRSYGCVHRWLANSGVQFRGRGGARSKPVNQYPAEYPAV